MGFKDCSKYERKANSYKEEIDLLDDRINDLMSIPTNPKTNQHIQELRVKRKTLEKKRVEALDAHILCMESNANDYH
ncbi:MAG: hypothetical protein HWE22_02265 [Flavobacteriales bacterium]|nr:hypothetical protein [Flavobacteriales bacterium]